jgi:hypothetical protein
MWTEKAIKMTTTNTVLCQKWKEEKNGVVEDNKKESQWAVV